MMSRFLRVPLILGRRPLVTSLPRQTDVTTTIGESDVAAAPKIKPIDMSNVPDAITDKLLELYEAIPEEERQADIKAAKKKVNEEFAKWFNPLPQQERHAYIIRHLNPPVPVKQKRNPNLYAVIGEREVVGPGVSGFADYLESLEYPFPAIRFTAPYPEIMPLLEKEKGDWRNLTIDEKKTLYRYSFRQTIEEEWAPDGLNKRVLIGTLLTFSLTLIYTQLLTDWIFPWNPAIQRVKQADWQATIVGKQIAQNTSKYTTAADWDYEKGEWRK